MSQSVSIAEVPPPPTSHRDVPSPSGGGERGRGHWFILGAVLLLAAALRFYKIDAQSLWYDEGNSARIAERSVQLIVEGAAGDIHPPLYYLLLKFWRGIFGDSEAGLRSLSALCGVFSVLFAFLIGRNLLGRRVGLVAAFLLAVAPFAVYYSQEARMYALLAVCAAASTWALIRLIGLTGLNDESGRMFAFTSHPSSFILYIVSTAAGLWTQYAYPFVLVAQGVCVLLVVMQHRSNVKRQLVTYIIASLIAIATYVPWLPIAIRQITNWGVERASFDLGPAVLDAYRTLVVGRTLPLGEAAVPLVAFTALVSIGLIVNARRKTHDSFVLRLALFTLAFLPLALLFVFGLYRDAYLKFLLVCVLPMCVLAANGIARIGEWLSMSFPRMRGNDGPGSGRIAVGLVAVITLALTVTFLPSLTNLYNNKAYARDDYRGIYQRIRADARADDAVIFIAPNQWEVYTYYQKNDHNLFPVAYRPAQYDAVSKQLEAITRTYTRLFVLYFAERDADPEGWYEQWLGTNAFKAHEEWIGNIRLAVYGAVRGEWGTSNRPNARFGDSIVLQEERTQLSEIRAGDIIPIELRWMNTVPLSERYKIFVHIGPDDGPPIAQNDSEPASGYAPTTAWIPGETVVDRRAVWINAGKTGDVYGMFVGLYDLNTGQRLPITVNGQPAGDRLKIGEITIR